MRMAVLNGSGSTMEKSLLRLKAEFETWTQENQNCRILKTKIIEDKYHTSYDTFLVIIYALPN